MQKLAELAEVESYAKSRMLAGKQYEEDDHLKEMKQVAKAVCNAFNQETDRTKRDMLLKQLLGNVGTGCDVGTNFLKNKIQNKKII